MFRAAWVLTVSQLAASENVILALTLSGRDVPLPDTMELTAPLLTTVPLCVSFSQSQSVDEFLNQLQAQANDMTHFQHFGLQQIISMQKQRGIALDLRQLLLSSRTRKQTLMAVFWASNSRKPALDTLTHTP